MFIVLSNRVGGKSMPDTENIETTAPAPQDEGQIRASSASRRAAAIEAAYILEAVRK
jgi:hypothetical protein